jgi:hypothetical protein
VGRGGYSLILSIAKAESTLCKRTLPNSYNCFGIGGASNLYFFNNYEEGIKKLVTLLTQDGYYANFRRSGSIRDLSTTYCPPTASSWANNVTNFKAEIQREAPDYRIN